MLITCIVYHDIKPTKSADGQVQDIFPSLSLSDVSLDEDQPRIVPGLCLSFGGIDVDEDDLPIFLVETVDNSGTEAIATPWEYGSAHVSFP